MILIAINIISVILESFENIKTSYEDIFFNIEVFSVFLFTIEYLLRLWIADFKYKDKNKLLARFIYIFSFMALIDFIAILPFYLPMLIRVDLRYLRIFRMFRLTRILKLNRYTSAFEIIKTVFLRKKEELITTIFFTSFLILVSSTMMYSIENEVQPEAFPNIIASLWWGVATLTTVGYGDVYPITNMGKFISAIISILGIGLVALPTGIISSGFIEEIDNRKKVVQDEEKGKDFCPHCGNKL